MYVCTYHSPCVEVKGLFMELGSRENWGYQDYLVRVLPANASHWLLKGNFILVKKKSQCNALRMGDLVENFRLSRVRADKAPDICKEGAQRVEGKQRYRVYRPLQWAFAQTKSSLVWVSLSTNNSRTKTYLVPQVVSLKAFVREYTFVDQRSWDAKDFLAVPECLRKQEHNSRRAKPPFVYLTCTLFRDWPLRLSSPVFSFRHEVLELCLSSFHSHSRQKNRVDCSMLSGCAVALPLYQQKLFLSEIATRETLFGYRKVF